MSRIFLSHSSKDSRQAVALKGWLVAQDPSLSDDVFLDVDPVEGLQPGLRWKDALQRASSRCEAVICLLSANWANSKECAVEYRTADHLGKQIFAVRLEPSAADDLLSEWQRCDLFGAGPTTAIELDDGGPPVVFATAGLCRLRDAVRGSDVAASAFVWPPPDDPQRAPYRGWQPFERLDAGVFFGRDAQIVKALDALRGLRSSGRQPLFVILGPAGAGKSSFLRAGLLPRLARDDRQFVVLDVMRPERDALTGHQGFAEAMISGRRRFRLPEQSAGEVKQAFSAGDVDRIVRWLNEIRSAATERLPDEERRAPTLVLPIDQAEELFTADGGPEADAFLRICADICDRLNAHDTGFLMVTTIRTDCFEMMQTHPALAAIDASVFDTLKPMPVTQFREIITGPAARATEAGERLTITPDLVNELLSDVAEGADTLPMLSLTLARLYADYGSTGALTLPQYHQMGGVNGVVHSEIDRILASDPNQRIAQLEVLRSAFIPWLVTINPDNDQPMRRVARWSDLPSQSRPLIDALVASRLLIKDIRQGEVVVEVALESLLRQWDDLAGWLRDVRTDLKAADDLDRAAHSWESADRDAAWLLTGTRLDSAESLSLRAEFAQRLATSGSFLAASREAEELRGQTEQRLRDSAESTAHTRTEPAPSVDPAPRSSGSGIFINYRRDDEGFAARALYEMLGSRFGKQQVFWDIDRIPLGHDFIEAIERSIAQCDVMLVMIGAKWLTCTEANGVRRLDNPSDFVRLEIETALARPGVLVIPIAVGSTPYPTQDDLPESMRALARRNGMTLDYHSFDDDFQRLLRALERIRGL